MSFDEDITCREWVDAERATRANERPGCWSAIGWSVRALIAQFSVLPHFDHLAVLVYVHQSFFLEDAEDSSFQVACITPEVSDEQHYAGFL